MITEAIFIVKVIDREITKEYRISAKDKESAKSIAKEAYENKYGYNPEIKLGVKYAKPNTEEINYINKKLETELEEIKKTMNGMNYAEFLEEYERIKGFEMDSDNRGFWFKICNFTCKLNYNRGSYIDETKIYFEHENRLYIILDDCTTILIGRE